MYFSSGEKLKFPENLFWYTLQLLNCFQHTYRPRKPVDTRKQGRKHNIRKIFRMHVYGMSDQTWYMWPRYRNTLQISNGMVITKLLTQYVIYGSAEKLLKWGVLDPIWFILWIFAYPKNQEICKHFNKSIWRWNLQYKCLVPLESPVFVDNK